MYVCRAFLNACFGRFKVGLKDLSLAFIEAVFSTLKYDDKKLSNYNGLLGLLPSKSKQIHGLHLVLYL